MHELKRLLNEIEQAEIEPGKFIIPDYAIEANLTAEEKVLYIYYCYLKSNRKALPDLATISRQIGMREELLKITIEALNEKGITFNN